MAAPEPTSLSLDHARVASSSRFGLHLVRMDERRKCKCHDLPMQRQGHNPNGSQKWACTVNRAAYCRTPKIRAYQRAYARTRFLQGHAWREANPTLARLSQYIAQNNRRNKRDEEVLNGIAEGTYSGRA